jgi:transcriptional regulator with XRE-family HTH domain
MTMEHECTDSAILKRDIGGRLRTSFEAVDRSISAIAREFHFSQGRISNWCLGKHYPDPAFLAKYCVAYHIPTDVILLGTVPSVYQRREAIHVDWLQAGLSVAVSEDEREAVRRLAGRLGQRLEKTRQLAPEGSVLWTAEIHTEPSHATATRRRSRGRERQQAQIDPG